MWSFYSHGLLPLVRAALVAAAGLWLACSSQSPEEKLLDAVKPVPSWIATLRMTGERWDANSVPTSFVHTTVKAARKEFEKEAEEATRSKARPELRIPLHQVMTEAAAAADGLGRAAEANDRPGVAREVGRLAALQGELAALRKRNGGGSQ